MNEIIKQILTHVMQTEGLNFEYDNDIHKGRVTVTKYTGKGRGCQWETLKAEQEENFIDEQIMSYGQLLARLKTIGGE